MGTQRRIPMPESGVYGTRRNVGRYFHRIVTSTGGAIDAATSDLTADSGVTVVKTGSEVGRYTLTLPTPHKKLLMLKATPIGAADAAYGAATTGLPHFARNDLISTAGTVDLQFAAGDTNWADAEVPNGVAFMIEVVVEG